MDSKHGGGGVPLSATKATSSPPEVYPKVSLSTSTSGFSLPIRAPPTVDSENYNNSSCSSSSDSGFESEGFLSGEDEFETASDRPFFADPDGETLVESNIVEEHVVSRPFVTDPHGEIKEESEDVEEYVVSRLFVADPDGEIKEKDENAEDYAVSRPFVIDTDEVSLATPMEEEDGYFGEPAVVDIGISALEKVGVPIAKLSRDSDEDSVGTEESEDDGFSGVVRVPSTHLFESIDSPIKVRGFGVEDREEDESHFEPALEAEVEVKYSLNDSVSAELSRDKVPDDAEEATVVSFVEKQDEFLRENSGVSEDALDSIGEIPVLEDKEQQESENMTEVASKNKVGDVSRSGDDEKTGGMNERRIDLGVESHDIVACSGVETVDSGIAENGIHNTIFQEPYPAQVKTCYGNGLSPGTAENKVTEDRFHSKTNTLETQSVGFNLESEIEVKPEVEDKADHDSENSEGGSYSEDDSKGLIFGVSDTTNRTNDDDLEQSIIPTSLGEDEEVDTDGESEGNELFDSTVLAALLKAATGGRSGGGSFTVTSANGDESEEKLSEEEKKKLEKIQLIRVKFLRLVRRLGQSWEDSIVAQVLYHLVLVAGRPTSQSFSLEMAKRKAMQLESEGGNDLNFSLNILVLGKTGVGKSATINSIFGEKKAVVDAFEPATSNVKEIVGTIDGVKVRIFDTPGLRSSLMDQAFNRKTLLSIRKLTNKFPPDVVLYVDRLDTQTRDLNDLPLLRSITSLLGSSIWQNSVVTLTHAASSLPDGPTGSPLSYDLFVAQRSRIIQQSISQAIGDLRMMSPSLVSPVSVVENHPSCQKTKDGQILLPNGETWRPQLWLLCYSMKILSEANSVARTKDLFDRQKLFGFRARSPPLPYFLSSLLQSNAHPKLPAEQSGETVDSDIELGDFSDSDQENEDQDEDEYDQLPPFKPLKKTQIAKLSKEQRKAYFEEYDYRVRLLQKKQMRKELKRLKELKKRGKDGVDSYSYGDEDGDEESGNSSALAVPLPDMALPPSFDGDNPTYRYRFVESMFQLLARPVLDLHGWDHDCGYDGVRLEGTLAVLGDLPSVIAVQITKDKKDFNIHFDSSIAAKHGESGSSMAGLDIQSVGKQLAYVLKGETKFKNLKTNKTAAGLSVTFLGENVATGLKIEDQIVVGKRFVLLGSSGIVRSGREAACGANLEFRAREKDFPIGQDQSTVSLSLMRWRGELIWSGNVQSQFSVGRSSKMVVRAGLNSKLSGQVSVRTSSSDQLQIALLGIFPIANAIWRNFFPG